MTPSPPLRDARRDAHMPMVRQVAFKLIRRSPSGVNLDDLVSIGMIGLIEAVERFEDTRSDSFSAYARIRVQGAMLDELRRNDWVPRSVRDRGEYLLEVRVRLARELGTEPTEAQVAAAVGVSEARLRDLVASSATSSLVSLDAGLEDDRPLGDILPSDEPGAETILATSRRDAVLREAVGRLPPRERTLVEMHYFGDHTFKEIGRALGVTESRVSQMHTALCKRFPELLDPEALAA
jgi:RNA polymerase sigma factor for flagellar operon FliA